MNTIPDDVLIIVLNKLESRDVFNFFSVNKQLFNIYKSGKVDQLVKQCNINIFEEMVSCNKPIDSLFYDDKNKPIFSDKITSEYDDCKFKTVINFLNANPKIIKKLNYHIFHPTDFYFSDPNTTDYLCKHKNNLNQVIKYIQNLQDLSYIFNLTFLLEETFKQFLHNNYELFPKFLAIYNSWELIF
jgi:hypothetical protein